MMKPSIARVESAMKRFQRGDRPWTDRRVDWFVASPSGNLCPLKYTYALVINRPPRTFTTNQAKRAMAHLGLAYVSLKAQAQDKRGFDAAVKASLRDKSGRRKRLLKAQRYPSRHAVAHFAFRRNPDVVAEVLDRANGRCELCCKAAPFKRKDGTAYLEVHHRLMLAEGGEDSVENAVATCPNCHRHAHHG
jgi:5-methylcytosine-specific restriction enzyme A